MTFCSVRMESLRDEVKTLEANVDQWSEFDYARHQLLTTILDQSENQHGGY